MCKIILVSLWERGDENEFGDFLGVGEGVGEGVEKNLMIWRGGDEKEFGGRGDGKKSLVT